MADVTLAILIVTIALTVGSLAAAALLLELFDVLLVQLIARAQRRKVRARLDSLTQDYRA